MPDERQQAQRISAELAGFVGSVVRALTINVGAELVPRTPIDTGWARANWVSSIGRPVIEEVDRTGSPEQVQAANAKQAASRAGLATYRLDLGNTYVSNNVPYIQRLEDGHSQQAPTGFVRASLAAAIRGTEGLSRRRGSR